ncbi:hypothetical protein KI688_000684 [Linnemannia hyalina]|uniref:Uncharacterized protein n=1 Tax=Linnemannia hyalina TaxID=64524 RepID=A0A9P7Y5W9_9FUNG|nr:hypothetical protein KI688_000684 [Linnemannia hyalina]
MHTKDINIVDNVPTEVILKFAPYLDRSTLFKALRVYHPDPSLFDSIRNLLHLKNLDIDLPAQPTQALLQTLFPLFARLDEPILDRYWYSNIYEKDKSAFTLFHTNEKQQWKIK